MFDGIDYIEVQREEQILSEEEIDASEQVDAQEVDSQEEELESIVVYETPAQDKLRKIIEYEEKTLLKMYDAKNMGLSSFVKQKDIDKQKLLIKNKKAELQRLITCQKNMQKFREKKRKSEQDIKEVFPDLAKQLKLRDSVGRPPLEKTTCPDLLRDIIEIATIGSAADNRRREEVIRTVKTLDDLHDALKNMGYTLSRSALYLRLVYLYLH